MNQDKLEEQLQLLIDLDCNNFESEETIIYKGNSYKVKLTIENVREIKTNRG